MKKILIVFLLVSLINLGIANEIKIDYQTEIIIGSLGGDKWGATEDFQAIKDQDINTFLGLSGNNDVELEFAFQLKNITKISIIWIAGPNNKSPEQYFFSFYDLETSEWKQPQTWKSNETHQQFQTEYFFNLNKPVQTEKIRLFRNGTGPGSGIGIAEIQIFSKQVSDEPQEIQQPEKPSETTPVRTSPRTASNTAQIQIQNQIQTEDDTSLTLIEEQQKIINLKNDNNQKNFNMLFIFISIIILILITIVIYIKIKL